MFVVLVNKTTRQPWRLDLNGGESNIEQAVNGSDYPQNAFYINVSDLFVNYFLYTALIEWKAPWYLVFNGAPLSK